jgi:hypothetical protein
MFQDTIGGMILSNIGRIIWRCLIPFVISIDRTPADSFAAQNNGVRNPLALHAAQVG